MQDKFKVNNILEKIKIPCTGDKDISENKKKRLTKLYIKIKLDFWLLIKMYNTGNFICHK